MKKLISKLILIIICFSSIHLQANNCNTTIDDISVNFINPFLVNFDFLTTNTPNTVGYEFELYVNNVFESAITMSNLSATNATLTSSTDLYTACRVEIRGKGYCGGGDYGDENAIIITVDDLWECYDLSNICNSGKSKLVNFDYGNGIILEFDLECICTTLEEFILNDPAALLEYMKGVRGEARDRKAINPAQSGQYERLSKCSRSKEISNAKKDNFNIEEVNRSKSSVYPNPFMDGFKITTDSKRIEIFNINGELIKFEKDNDKISLNDYPKGLYFVKVYSENNIQTIPLIKQ